MRSDQDKYWWEEAPPEQEDRPTLPPERKHDPDYSIMIVIGIGCLAALIFLIILVYQGQQATGIR